MSGRGRHRRARARRTPAALGTVAAQFSQALGSFVLQLLAARTLGFAEFGVFALLVGGIVLATGVMTGFVGDSLTVLDRRDPAVRAALVVWWLVITAATAAVGAAAATGSGLVRWPTALLFGAAAAAWVAEDAVRRLLVAVRRSWSVVAVDLAHALTALGWLGLVQWWRRPELADFLLALVLGQVVALLVGLARTPAADRAAAPWRGAALSAVARFGAWRGAQQGIRPLTLTVVRVLVVVAAGRAAVGGLEAARVYTAPALLVVQGVGSALLVSYASNRDLPLRRALRRADRAVLALLGASAALGALATAAVGPLGGLVTGPGDRLDGVAVAGWAVFAASVAAGMPYASLAAVRGRQARVVGLRLVDAALSVGAAACVLWVLRLGPSAVPYAVAVGAFAGALLQRTSLARTAPAPGRAVSGAGAAGSATPRGTTSAAPPA